MAEAGGLQDITSNDTTPMPAGEPGRPRVNDMLRAAREAAGLDMKQLSQLTRVTSRHLEAIEAGDYASLPGRPYALGFARSYARAVGLDEKVIADLVRAELDRQAPNVPPRVINQFEVGDPIKTPTRLTGWLAAGLALAIALAGFVFWRSYYSPSAELPSLIGPEEATTPVPPPPAAASATPSIPSGPVVFTATQDRIWVKFYDGMGKQILQKELAKGESFTVPADAKDPKLWTGRPDALSITIGGQTVPPIAEKEGIVKDVPVTAAALLSRAATPAPSATEATPPTTSAAAAPRRNPVRRPVAAPSTVGSAAQETGSAAGAGPAATTTTAPASTTLR